MSKSEQERGRHTNLGCISKNVQEKQAFEASAPTTVAGAGNLRKINQALIDTPAHVICEEDLILFAECGS
jgi:hypothetical protein